MAALSHLAGQRNLIRVLDWVHDMGLVPKLLLLLLQKGLVLTLKINDTYLDKSFVSDILFSKIPAILDNMVFQIQQIKRFANYCE